MERLHMTLIDQYTHFVFRLSHRKWRETKQQLSRARSVFCLVAVPILYKILNNSLLDIV